MQDGEKVKQIVRSGRRIVLPPGYCEEFGIIEGEVVFVERAGAKLIVTPTEVKEKKQQK